MARRPYTWTDALGLELYSTNIVGLHFRDVVEQIKESGKKRKLETYKMGKKNVIAGTNLGQIFQNIIISSNSSLKLIWKVI